MQELPSSSVAFKAWRVCVAAGRPRAAGLAAAFDVYRLLPPVLVTGPNVAAVAQHHFEGSMMPTVSRGGGLQQRFGKLKQWIVNLDTQRAKAKADRGQDLPAWDTLHRGLNTMLKPYVFDGVDDRFEVFFRTPTGRVPLEALSDGLRSVFVIVCEMMFRMSLAADSPERILDQEMLCLIDEIDAHLHPRWQETVLPGLRALFPNSQIVATTHSPIVAATAQPHEVFRLEEEA